MCCVMVGIFVFMLCRYNADDLDDIHCHLTNTARAAEDINFDETKFVRVRCSLRYCLPCFLCTFPSCVSCMK